MADDTRAGGLSRETTRSASETTGFARPLLDVGPVPARSAGHRPSGFGKQLAMSPHGDRVALHAESPSYVVAPDRVAVLAHGSIVDCNARVDKCNVRSYNRDMQASEILIGSTVHIADTRKGYQRAIKVLAVTEHPVLPMLTIETHGRFTLTVRPSEVFATETAARRARRSA